MLLPLLAPLVDMFLIYGLLFLDPVTTLIAWASVLAIQLVAAVYRLPARAGAAARAVAPAAAADRLPAADVRRADPVGGHGAGGIRLRWQKLRRVGGLEDLLRRGGQAADPGTTEIPRERLVVLGRR